ncbi:hypothetical protein DAMA08_046050 [Martiniozyma asiatica (nom. inval.)]|nr:hypothetical protein DAMA08_046050 [Martiniozyma asiatica]
MNWTTLLLQELSNVDNKAPFHLLALATISSGLPRVRNVVLRGLHGQQLLFVTNRGSNKFKELVAEPRCEAVVYFQGTRCQYRFRGPCAEIKENRLRCDQWGALSMATRATFNGMDDFVLMGISVEAVHLLDLGTDSHQQWPVASSL